MKKVLKVVGVAVLIAAAALAALIGKHKIDSQKPILDNDYYTAFPSGAPLECRYAGLGTYEVSFVKQETEDEAIREYRIWYPTPLEGDAETYPLILVTNASETPASQYEPFFERLASWGFIVVGNEDRQAGTGLSTSQTLAYVLGLDGDPSSVLYGKVNQDQIGAVGYSQGGAGAIRAVTEYADSGRYRTIFTGSAAYPLLARNMGWEYDTSKVAIPYFMVAGTGTSDDTGVEDTETEFGGVSPLSSLVENYDKITDDVFKIRARISGAEHGDMLTRADGYLTAWMLYQLRGDGDAGRVFIGEGAEILSNPHWQDVEKNR